MDPIRRERGNVPDGNALCKAFDVPSAPTIGVEEEIMLLDPDTLDLLPRAPEIIQAAGTDSIGPEFPASQVELRTRPHGSVCGIAAELMELRLRATTAAAGIGGLAAAGVHPFAAAEGAVTSGAHYEELLREYDAIARRQLVCALHVHVALRPSDRAVAVYNAVRTFLPEIAALAANCPFYCGADSGLASVRPTIAGNLPRQGIPPPLTDMNELARLYAWCSRAGMIDGPESWWWEARLNPKFGTLEIRVPDAQTTVEEAAGVAAVVQALCVWLSDRYETNDLPAPVPSWRIEQNRWRACRFGLDGLLADLVTGEPVAARDRWGALLDELAPVGERLGGGALLNSVRRRVQGPTTAAIHRALVRDSGTAGLVRHLMGQFLAAAK